MAAFGEDPYHWQQQFCTGCRQVTWHYAGVCSNVDFHRSGTAWSLEREATPDQVVPSARAPEPAAVEGEQE